MTQSHTAYLIRDTLRLGGEDARAFLQGLVSNDITLCQPGTPIYAALLTPQGKYLHDMFIVDVGDTLLIDCNVGEGDALLQKLKAHKLRAKVTFENVSSEHGLWASWGSTLTATGWSADPRNPALGARLLAPKNSATTTNASADDYDRLRLSLGITDGAKDMLSGKSTLQEGNIDLLNGISWSKGCYMGQELTARIHYRGLVKKRLHPIRIEGAAPAIGTVITYNDKDCGDMRSSNGSIGLALLDIEIAKQPGASFMCGSTKLSVITASAP